MKNFVSKNKLGAGLKLVPWLGPLFLLVITGCAGHPPAESNANYRPYYVPSRSAWQTSKISTNQPPAAEPVPHTATNQPPAAGPVQSTPVILREGDTVQINVPSSPTLNTTEQIRMDGKIVMPLIGDVTAAGKTPTELQNDLIKLYEPQVETKQVIVTLLSSSITVFVTGSVLRPGKTMADHPISVLEAVMDAGVDYNTADLSKVAIIRQGPEGTTTFKVNLKKVMAGAAGKPFYLKPFDIVRVPEKFTWF